MANSDGVALTASDLYTSPLWYFFRMKCGNWYNNDLWWGYTGWEAFGWWEGENPFKGMEAGKDFDHGDITYVKSLENLDSKEEAETYGEPQGKRAYFIVQDVEDALDRLADFATSFSLVYEDGVVKLFAWNKEKPDFKACLMIKYNWKKWCAENFYGPDCISLDFGMKMMEYAYGLETSDPVYKDGKLVFGDDFTKTPEEFVRDLAVFSKRS